MRPAIPFHCGLLDRVQGFECGAAPWQVEVAEFLKAPLGVEGAASFVAAREADVWLYEGDDGDLIGYACLGSASWWLTRPQVERPRRAVLQVVHFIGLRPRYWRQPADRPASERYAWRILEDVMDVAVKRQNNQRDQFTVPVVAGLVQAQNIQALRFCKKFGFQVLNPGTTGYCRLIYPI